MILNCADLVQSKKTLTYESYVFMFHAVFSEEIKFWAY